MTAQKDQIDFTMMYVTHNALRRDAGRLVQAAAAGRAGTPGVRAGWENFKEQLHVHHTVEDDDLWPRLYRAVADRPAELALLREMEDEHAVLDPLLEQIDAAIKGPQSAELNAHLEQLARALDHHLKHEEDAALPLIQEVLEESDWRAFGRAMARKQGFKGAARYVPWIVDEASDAERSRFFGVLPPPVKVINKLVWEPKYRRMSLWATA